MVAAALAFMAAAFTIFVSSMAASVTISVMTASALAVAAIVGEEFAVEAFRKLLLCGVAY